MAGRGSTLVRNGLRERNKYFHIVTRYRPRSNHPPLPKLNLNWERARKNVQKDVSGERIASSCPMI